MKTNLEKLEKGKVRVTVEVSPAEFQHYSARAYDKLALSVAIKGFRPGKAPKMMITEAIGAQRLLSEALNIAISESYPKAVIENKLNPISQPAIAIKEYPSLSLIEVPGQEPKSNTNLVYQAEFDVMPQVVVGDLTKLKIEDKNLVHPKIEVKPEEVEQIIANLQRREASFEDKNTPCKEGDRVVLDFTGHIKSVVLDNLSSKNYPVILGDGVLIADFEKQILGMKKNDEKTFTVKMPTGPEKKEQEVEFSVKMLEVQKIILPKLDEKFVQKFNQKSVDALRQKIADNIKIEKETRLRMALEGHILQQAIKMMKVDLPESLAQKEYEKLLENFNQFLQKQGLSKEQYLKMLKKSPQDLDDGMKRQAQDSVKIGLLLGEIVKREKIDHKDPQAAKKAMDKLISYAKHD